MRVLVSTTAGAGHFGPLVPFARACAAAGHDVVVAAPRSFASAVEVAGLEHRGFDDVPDEVIGPVFARLPALSFEEANGVVVTEVFGRLDAQAALPGLTDLVERWRPDVVLREPCELGSLAAARVAGVPQVEVAIGLGASTDFLLTHLPGPLAELDALAGLPEGAAAEATLSAPVLSSVPAVLDHALGSSPHLLGRVHRFGQMTPSPGDGRLPGSWGDPAHPLVYVSFGSVAAGLGPFAGVYAAAVAAFADRPVRVLLTTGEGLDPADLQPLPANVRVERWWPQAEVMPQCAAMVGHGGFGTTMTALAAGVPQVVVPLFAHDQRVNAEHVAAVGAGVHLDGGPEAMAALPAAVDDLLADPAGREAAALVGDEMAALPPAADAVALVERVAAG